VGPSSLGGLLDDGGEGLGQLAGLLALAVEGLGIGGGWPAVAMMARGGCSQLFIWVLHHILYSSSTNELKIKNGRLVGRFYVTGI